MVDLNLQEVGGDIADDLGNFGKSIMDFAEENPQIAVIGAFAVGILVFFLVKKSPGKLQSGGIFPSETTGGSSDEIGGNQFNDDLKEEISFLEDQLSGIIGSQEERFAAIEAAFEQTTGGFASALSGLEANVFGALEQNRQYSDSIADSVSQQLNSLSSGFSNALAGINQQGSYLEPQIQYSIPQQAASYAQQYSEPVSALNAAIPTNQFSGSKTASVFGSLFSTIGKGLSSKPPIAVVAPTPITSPKTAAQQNLNTLLKPFVSNDNVFKKLVTSFVPKTVTVKPIVAPTPGSGYKPTVSSYNPPAPLPNPRTVATTPKPVSYTNPVKTIINFLKPTPKPGVSSVRPAVTVNGR